LLARGKFRHVQILLHLAELGSIQRTASALGMTQSSVTQTLAYLENLRELPLFERHSRGVRPTPLCMDLLPVARQLMLGIMNSAEVIAARRRKGEGTVRLIGSAAAINGLLLSALPAFSEQYPAIQVQLREAEGEDQLLAVARGEVDLVVCRRPSNIPEGWEFQPLREDRLVVVCRSTHPLARSRVIRPSDLADQTWLLLPTGSQARRQFDKFSEALPKMPATYPVVTVSLPMIWALLQSRPLLALLPRNLATPSLAAGELVELLVDPSTTMEPIGVLQPEKSATEASRRFTTYLRSIAHNADDGPTTPNRKTRRSAVKQR
jgi:DNA-binding transcriptional LysR family regulator